MNNMKKKINIFSLIILVIMLAIPVLVLAQEPPDPGGDPDVPIDGGLSLLIAGGVAYGAKKVRDARKKK